MTDEAHLHRSEAHALHTVRCEAPVLLHVIVVKQLRTTYVTYEEVVASGHQILEQYRHTFIRKSIFSSNDAILDTHCV